MLIVWECKLKKAMLAETDGRLAEEIVRSVEFLSCSQEERRRAREVFRREMGERKEREKVLLSEVKL